jgi:hypothetical protein
MPYIRHLLSIFFVSFVASASAQDRFIPDYPFFPQDMSSISDSAKKQYMVNGAQLKNYSSYPAHKATPVPKPSDATTMLSIFNGADVLILSEQNALFETRALATRSLPQLAALGFKYVLFDVAADTSFFPSRRKFPIAPENPRVLAQYGYMMREPLFASIVREARRLNMTASGLLPSADSSVLIHNYLSNRIAQIRTKDSTAKILVYLTGGDIATDKLKQILSKAGRLRISVLETYDSDKISTFTEQEDSAVAKCSTYALYKNDSLRIGKGELKRYFMLSNFKCFYESRPHMISRFMNRHYQSYDYSKYQILPCPCAVAVYRLDELAFKDRAIPFDVVHVDRMVEKSYIAFNPSKYFIYAWNQNGKLLSDFFWFLDESEGSPPVGKGF